MQTLKNSGVPGIRLHHWTMSTPQQQMSAWYTTSIYANSITQSNVTALAAHAASPFLIEGMIEIPPLFPLLLFSVSNM